MISKNSSVESAFLKSESSPVRVVLPGAMEQNSNPPALSVLSLWIGGSEEFFYL